MNSTILVIGSNSFSGASFVRYLLDLGCDVIGCSRSPEPINALLPYKFPTQPKGRFRFYQYDLNENLVEINTLIDAEKPNHIYNFAAQSMVGQSWDFPEHWFMTNAVSTIKLHNLIRQKDFVDKYIHISTPEVYGSCTGFVNESQVYNPSTPYAVSRAAADMSLKTFFDVHQFPVVTTRAANVYGEGQQLYRIIPKTILSILKGESLQLHGGGHSERSFIHIDDVSDATYKIGLEGEIGQTYHISTKDIISIRNLVETICGMMSADFELLCQITEDRAGKDAAYLLDANKVRNTLNWQDQITLEKGLERTINWLTTHFSTLKDQPSHYIHKV
ncbi:GDP-mannose 4,6-dehydratase [Algibacillus agarilyticus]|uniref:GDP-mannose 4,6-dehydratase n=1 Tax=Algibacillus agarilyticus TaxID=2234133 RepID=UPI000DD09E74|nr:GDP-mannose 4,6-dehydratase [Algibacillus agarilyticus]